MSYKYKRVVVKVGSNVLSCADGTLDVSRMSALVDQIAQLRSAGVELVLVSSGAVAAGRSEFTPCTRLDSVDQRQLFSAIGQAKLINHYYELFRCHDICAGQILTTRESFCTRRHYLNQRNCMMVMLQNGVVPIVNENDTISVTELMFTDNDELSGLIASMLDAEALVILSNVDGIYDGPPSDARSKVIREVTPDRDLAEYIQAEHSDFGRGGMLTKASIARKIADEGVAVYIANGKKDNILLQILQDESSAVCTHFVPSHTISSVKRWIAHSDGFAKGEIHLNRQAVAVLRGDKAVSLLPVGVEKVEGDFEKDDIVRIMDEDQCQIGVGRVSADAAQAREQIGKHGMKPLVHYDYLYLEQ